MEGGGNLPGRVHLPLGPKLLHSKLTWSLRGWRKLPLQAEIGEEVQKRVAGAGLLRKVI